MNHLSGYLEDTFTYAKKKLPGESRQWKVGITVITLVEFILNFLFFNFFNFYFSPHLYTAVVQLLHLLSRCLDALINPLLEGNGSEQSYMLPDLIKPAALLSHEPAHWKQILYQSLCGELNGLEPLYWQSKISAIFHNNWMKDLFYSLGYTMMCV